MKAMQQHSTAHATTQKPPNSRVVLATRRQHSSVSNYALHKRQLLQCTCLFIVQHYTAAGNDALADSLQDLQVLQQQEQQQWQQKLVLNVGSGRQYESIQSAVNAALPGSQILIDPGKYFERLVISKSLTLAAAQGPGSVDVIVDTQQPYQHGLAVTPDSSSSSSSSSNGQPVEVVIQQLSFRHYSKSVADNYCIFAQAGQLVLQQCDISSRSGVGVCVQGAALQLEGCTVHDCAAHGVAVYGALEGGMGMCAIQNSSITGNSLNGVLVRDGADFSMAGCRVQGNAGFGLQLQDCSAAVANTTVTGNRAGPATIQQGSVDVDLQQLAAANTLDGAVRLF